MAFNLLALFGILLATYVFLRVLQSATHGVNEPPILAGEIPFISPLFGMMNQNKLFTRLRDKYNLPVYTLRLPGSRLYIINSTKLILAAQRFARELDFTQIEISAVVRVGGATQRSKEILEADVNGLGKNSYVIEFNHAIHPALSPGSDLDALNRRALEVVARSLDSLAAEAPRTTGLFEWSRKEIAAATSEAVYGPLSPFNDPEMLEAFRKFEPGIVALLLGLPSFLAKESIEAREKLAKAFNKYFEARGHEQGSALVRARYKHSAQYGICLDDIARFELGGAVAVLSNTLPTIFWLIWHAMSDSTVLHDLRAELEPLCRITNDAVTLDITEVKHAAPTLVSTLQEVMRVHSMATSVRMVQEDHLLNGEYLLKKGSILMIPQVIQHTSTDIYGAQDQIRDFQHKRFVRSATNRLNPAGFRGFGGGKTLCPGRHFASTEILAFAALMILRFDLRPMSGEWVRPTTFKSGPPAAIPTPDKDVEVRVTPRGGRFEGKRWNLVLKGSDRAMGLVAEDVNGN